MEKWLASGYEPARVPQKLSDIRNDYTLVVFGASWCLKCPEELSQLSRVYNKFKNHGVEMVFISLDQDIHVFRNFSAVFPFISSCDYQKWESPVVAAYHVFATPTMYLLDSKREILLRPHSVRHADAWVDWNFVRGKQ